MKTHIVMNHPPNSTKKIKFPEKSCHPVVLQQRFRKQIAFFDHRPPNPAVPGRPAAPPRMNGAPVIRARSVVGFVKSEFSSKASWISL